MQDAKMRPQGATAAHTPNPAAAVNDTGVSGGLFCDQHRGLQPSSEKGGDIQRAAQVPLSRAFIDNPFCARRPVLRELPFAGPAGVGWGVAATDTAAAWATQESHEPSESTGARTDTLFSGSFPEGDDSGRSGGEEARQRFGLESQDPLSGTAPDKTSVPRLENDKGGMGGFFPCWREGHGTGNLDQLDDGVNWRKPVWGESGDEKTESGSRHDGGQTNTNFPTQEELAFRGSGGAQTNADQVCEVNLGGSQ